MRQMKFSKIKLKNYNSFCITCNYLYFSH